MTTPAGRGRVVVGTISSAATRQLRHRVLRANQPFEETVYPDDDAPGAVHFGAYLDGRLLGIASLYREDRSGADAAGWRLRGMASAPEARGQGIGRALLQACVEHVARGGGGELWCNARTPAAGFYARAGFDVLSEPFEIEGIGRHVVMRRLVPAEGA